MNLDFSPYAVGGAAARADSFTRLDPNFATGVYGLTQAAHAAGIPLQITSAYRSPPTQARIVADGMAKYGLGDRADAWRADVARLGPVAAGQQWRPEMREAGLTRFIAMPGGSQHQRGTAVDFALNGSLIRDADSPAAQFIRNNAQQYGLSVPMSWEPWQAEPIGNAGRITGAPQATMTTRNAPTNTQTTGVQMDGTQQSSGDLSRNQRMMLGFAALRDAGAALQGQNSNFFADTMGGFQQQAQAADDRAFRQMQFDESVRQFGVGQAGSAEQRRILEEQERRLARENQINILGQLGGFETQVRELEETNAARAQAGLPPLPLSPYVTSQISMLQRMLSQSGYSPAPGAGTPAPGAGTPAPGAGTQTPVVTPTPGAGTQTAPDAYAVIDNPGSTPEDIAGAMAFLQNLNPTARDLVGDDAIDAAMARGQARIDAISEETQVEAQSAEQIEAKRLQVATKGQTVVDYLLRGIDENTGEFIINPKMMIAGTRNALARGGDANYQEFASALDNIRETIAAETIGILNDRGVSLGVNLTDTDMDIIRNIATTISVDNPLGTLNSLKQFEEITGVDLGLGTFAVDNGSSPFQRIEGGGSFEAGGLTFEEVN